jgi:SAM-dependent methyltransferase
LGQLGLQTTCFNIDGDEQRFPFAEGHFDAVIALATIEHVIHVDHLVEEIRRILSDGGYFYVSAPNYTGLLYLSNFLLSGRTFHDPLSEASRYEFYAHVRYFTYRTLLEYVSSFGFIPDTVYLALPAGSSRYQALYARSKLKALTFRYAMWLLYTLLPPRWASEPILCFQKTSSRVTPSKRVRKVVL